MRTDKLRETLSKCVSVLRQRRMDFDAIAFRGHSGALIAAPLALALDKTMLMVRKPGVNAHSYRLVEGDMAAKTYIIVDDTVSSGATVHAITDAIEGAAPQARCVGVLETDELSAYLAHPSRPLIDVHRAMGGKPAGYWE